MRARFEAARRKNRSFAGVWGVCEGLDEGVVGEGVEVILLTVLVQNIKIKIANHFQAHKS